MTAERISAIPLTWVVTVAPGTWHSPCMASSETGRRMAPSPTFYLVTRKGFSRTLSVCSQNKERKNEVIREGLREPGFLLTSYFLKKVWGWSSDPAWGRAEWILTEDCLLRAGAGSLHEWPSQADNNIDLWGIFEANVIWFEAIHFLTDNYLASTVQHQK